jgi:cellulose synthase catalytic subunit (UDP-forming)
MHASRDFNSRRASSYRVDVSELILDRGRSTGDSDTSTDGRSCPRLLRRRGRFAVVALSTLAIAGAVALGVLLVVPLGWGEQAIVGAILIAGVILLSSLSRSPAVTIALMAVSMFATMRYGYWRVVQTWEGVSSAGHLYQWDTVFVFMLLAAECYAFCALALGYFQTLRPLHRSPAPLSTPPDSWPTVDVFITTYDEPLDVVRATVLGALALDYPRDRMNVFVLDDGRRKEFREWTERVGARYLTRDDNAHAKAGNINAALARSSGELVAIFDADQVPTRSFLQLTVGWFLRDRRLALVQTPQHVSSPDPFERNLGQFHKVPNEGALFHRLVQDGNDLWNASFFSGSCAVMRRDALDAVGGIAVDTVTEHAHTAIRMQCRGWNTAYINMPQAAGRAAQSLSAHISQRIRSARGMVQVLRLENPLFCRGLSLPQRLCYFTATTHFLFAVPRLIFLTAPLAYLLFGIVSIYGYSLAVFAYAMPHLVLAHLTNARVQRGFRSAFWNEIYEAVLAPYVLLPTLHALVRPRHASAPVTAKGGIVERTYFDHRVALPFIVLIGLNVAGLSLAHQRFVSDPAHPGTVVMYGLWAIYNTIILSVGASVARERRQRRSDVRVDVRVPLTLVTPDGHRVSGMAAQLSTHGATGWLDTPLVSPMRSEVFVQLDAHGSRCAIDARVVSIRGGREVHLLFPRLTTEQERFLVDAIYSRPETWLTADAGREGDSPLGSLWRVTWLSLRGLVVIAGGMFTRRRPAHKAVPSRKRAHVTAASIIAVALLTPGGAVANDVALLPTPFFEPALQGSWQLPVIFWAAPDVDEVKAAAVVASWFGVASDVRGVRFPVTIGGLSGGNAVVIARRSAGLDRMLSLPPTPRTLVAVRDNPLDANGKVLVITGDRAQDVLAAANALVNRDYSSAPHGDTLAVGSITVPRREQYDAPRWLRMTQPAPIGRDITDDRMRLAPRVPLDVYFRLPPDLYLSARQSVPLRLRFRYSGVGEHVKAAVHVRLNAHDADSIPLAPATGVMTRDEIVRLPTRWLRRYSNMLTIAVDFGDVDAASGLAQYASIDRESSIDLRGLPHSVVLPRLELVTEAGYPFTGWPDLSGTAIVLSDTPTVAEYETLLNMVGFFGAQTGTSVTGVTVVDPTQVERVRDDDLVILGGPLTQPLLSMWASYMALGFTGNESAINSLPRWQTWLHPQWPFRPEDRDRLARLVGAGYRFDAVLEHFVSPYRRDRSVLAIVGGDDAGAAAAATFTTERTGPIYGGVSVARNGRFESFLLGVTAYHAGRTDRSERAFVLLLEHYWLIPVLVLLAAVAIGGIVYAGTERIAARRLAVGRI